MGLTHRSVGTHAAAVGGTRRAGERIVYINCSGDPDSLDGAIFLDRNAAIVDGTSPHVLEPTYAVARASAMSI